MAVANYTDLNGHLPPAYLADANGRPAHSWRILILPWLEQEPLFRAYNWMEPWNGPNNRQLANQMPSIFAMPCHENPIPMITNYVVVVGERTAFPPGKTVKPADVIDGLGNTILVTENRGANIHWMEPRDLRFDEMDFTINSPGGIGSCYSNPSAVMIDGSVHMLDEKLPAETLRALLTIDGKEEALRGGERGWEMIPDGRERPLADPR